MKYHEQKNEAPPVQANSKGIIVATLYKFVALSDFADLRAPLLNRCLDLGLKGTILIAREGINGTVAGDRPGVDGMLQYLQSDARFRGLEYKESIAGDHPFHRMKVKLKNEVVSMGLNGVSAEKNTGTHIDPENWNDVIHDPDTLVLDVRNHYECEIGTFKNAVSPKTQSFREFPDYVEKNLHPHTHTKIAMFCTGGIRCEKAASYLLDQGFQEVMQLRGGIQNYLDKVDKQSSLWQGECFVFDARVAINHDLEKGSYEQCFACRRPITQDDINSAKYQPGVSCPHCYDTLSPAQRERFQERQRQVDLAEQRGEKHIGVRLDER